MITLFWKRSQFQLIRKQRFLGRASLSPTFYHHLLLIIDSGMNADFLSESGCPGFEDVQDVIAHLFVGG